MRNYLTEFLESEEANNPSHIGYKASRGIAKSIEDANNLEMTIIAQIATTESATQMVLEAIYDHLRVGSFDTKEDVGDYFMLVIRQYLKNQTSGEKEIIPDRGSFN